MTYAIIGALCIGLSLGLLGSGGSILTVPVLVLLLNRPEKLAIAESLAIVGGIALIGAIPYAVKRTVDWRSVLFFGLPGMGGAYVGSLASRHVSGAILLALFAIIMLTAAALMLRSSRPTDINPSPAAPPPNESGNHQQQAAQPPNHRAFWRTILDGFIVGLITGFVGVGGGFLIVPALVILGRLPMRRAVGTSLCVIALNSGVGFYKHVQELAALNLAVDWNTVSLFLAVGVVGSLVGNVVGGCLNQRQLRRAFGVFLVVIGAYIFIRQILLLMQ